MVLYALVHGYLPFDDEDIPTLYAAIMHATYEVADGIPSGGMNEELFKAVIALCVCVCVRVCVRVCVILSAVDCQ